MIHHRDDSWAWYGWGTSLCWFADAIGDDADKTAAVCQELFRELGLNIVRYNIGGSPPTGAVGYRTGGAVPCCKTEDGGIDLRLDRRQLNVLRAARAVAPGLRVEAFVNSPPYFWTASGSSKGHGRRLRDNLRPDRVGDFAGFVADVVSELRQREGIDCAAVSPFNEPLSPMWVHPSNQQEGCYFSRGTADAVVRALRQRGGVPQVSVHEENSVLDALWRRCTSRQRGDRVAVHTYTVRNFRPAGLLSRVVAAFQDNAALRWALRRLTRGGELVVSEYAQSGHAGFAEHVLRDLRTLRPSAWMYWQGVEDAGSDWGLLHTPLVGATGGLPPLRDGKYYILRLFVRHLSAGMRMFAHEDGIAAWDPATGLMNHVFITHRETDVFGPCAVSTCPLAEPWRASEQAARVAEDDRVALPAGTLVGVSGDAQSLLTWR